LISGLWIYGSNVSIREDSPVNAPAMAAWKEPIQRRVLDASGMRGVVIPSARGYYVIGNGLKSTAAELTEAAAVAAGAAGAVPGSDEEARGRLGDYFAEVLLLDQGTEAAKARSELGWLPSRPGLVDELRHRSYRS